MTEDQVRAAKSPRQRHREACAALDAAVALNDTDAMREALREIKAAETDDQSYADPLAAAVAARLKLDKNRSRRLLGQLPNQEEE